MINAFPGRNVPLSSVVSTDTGASPMILGRELVDPPHLAPLSRCQTEHVNECGRGMRQILVHSGRDITIHRDRWEDYVSRKGRLPLSYHPSWLSVLERGMGHTPYCLEAVEGNEIRGILPLVLMRSMLFGRFLVGLPYLNYGGVLADDEQVANQLVDEAVKLADSLDVRTLELRHERGVDYGRLTKRPECKVYMRLSLPSRVEDLWKRLKPSVRNEVRKGRKNGLSLSWGGEEVLPEFYSVFSRNLRDLGTPVYGRALFQSVIQQFPDRAEFCVVRMGSQPIAAALLLHGWGTTEVPSAGSLRRYNSTCANMLMYWNLLERAIERGQETFDFGRSTPGGSVFQFKKQWGAEPTPAVWQYFVRKGEASDMRPDNPRYRRMIRVWQRLPVRLTRWIGPRIVRGIP